MPHAPSLPNGDVLGQFVTIAVDGVLRREGQALWAALSATGLVGPGRSILSCARVGGGPRSAPVRLGPLPVAAPREHALDRRGADRPAGHLDVERRARPEGGPSPEAAATFGADAVVLQRLILGVAADTYDELFTLKVEILGTAADPPQFLAGVLSMGAIAAPVNLGAALQLSLDPLNAPFALAMTDFGHVTQIAGSPPKLTLSAKTAAGVRVRSGRRDPPQPPAARLRG